MVRIDLSFHNLALTSLIVETIFLFVNHLS